jgi:hypothetical protein
VRDKDVPAAERFAIALHLVGVHLSDKADMDWSGPAGTLEWTCWQTADHLVDCLFSYALQLSSRSPGPFLPFQELHALPEATNNDLVSALQGVGELFCDALEAAPDGPCAGDGLVQLDAEGWAQRGAYELLIHGHDILIGLGDSLAPPSELCSWVLGSEELWMLDTERALRACTPWSALLLGSGRADALA